jgi:ankyrin repeat protein
VLVDTFGVDVHAANKRGRMPLHIACETGGSALLIALSKSKSGIDANVRNPVDGKTSLHVAVKRGDLRVVRELL